MTNTNFGVEFEFLIPNGYGFSEFSGVLKYLGKLEKLNFISDDSADHNLAKWFIHEDYSIDGHGMEISSPILSGKKGLKEVSKLVKLLNKLGCKVNKSCGLHVHVEAKKLKNVEKLSILARYSRLENEIDKYVAPHRRQDKSEFAQKIDFNDIVDMVHDEYNLSSPYFSTDKYMKVNIHERYPTIEFRHHEGSLNEKKVLNWIQFCVNFRNQTVKQFKILNRKNKDVLDVYNKLSNYKSVYGLKNQQIRYLNYSRPAA